MKKVASMLGVIGISLFLLINTGCEDDLLSSLIDLSNINDSTKSIITKIDTVVKTDTIVTIEPIKEIEKNEIYVDNPGDNKDIQPNILIAYNRAKEGDCIVLPAGTFTFSNSLEFKKLVSLKGAGMNQTILYRPETMSDGELNSKCFLVWNINRDSSSHLTISDFTLKSKNPAGMNKLNGSLATDFGIKIYKAVDFVITNCKFENFGYAALWIIHKDALARGLIYKNQFYHNFKGDGLGLGYGIAVYGENLKWIDSPSFGSSNFIYIEDNVFEYHRHSVCGGGNGLYVARYNIIKNNTVHHAIDMHNARGGNLGAPNYFSTRAAEVYKNDIVNTKCKDGVTDVINGNAAQIYKLTDQAITFCGGESVIFENNISGYTRGIRLLAAESSTSGKTYPLPFQIGYISSLSFGANHKGVDSNHGSGDCFIWDNNFQYTNKSNPDNLLVEIYYTANNLIVLNRDYHLTSKPNYTPYIYPHPLRK